MDRIDSEAEDFQRQVLAARPALTAFAWRLHRQEADVEDLVQETMTRALNKRHQFTPGSNLKAWLFTIMRNRFNSGYHVYRREAPHGEAVIEARSGKVDTQFGNLWARESFGRLLSDLAPPHREILILIPVMGLSYEDAAEICHCSIGTIKSRLFRARASLEQQCGSPAA